MSRLDALVIGGGPAGCSCALWLHQLGLAAALIERGDRLGGLQAESPYPNGWIAGVMGQTGIEFARNLERHVESLGLPIHRRSAPIGIETETDGFRVTVRSDNGTTTIETAHLVVATGVEPRSGGLSPGANVLIGPGRNVDEYDFAGKRVAILGGGDNAAENYGFIEERRPARVRIFARTRLARPSLAARVPAEAWRDGPYTVDAERLAITSRGETERYDVLVVLYGWQACLPEALAKFGREILDARGFIATDHERRTAIRGLWAIGEVAQALHPCCVTAMSDGVVCAKGIERDRLGEATRYGGRHERGGSGP